MKIPKVFVSYSHDSSEHKQWVLQLATRLRGSGVDAVIDQWELSAGDDLPHFMETNLASCDRVLMVCTSNYVKKANAGKGGVGYEKMIVTSELLSRIDSNKLIPIIRQQNSQVLPTFLKSKLYIDMSDEDSYEFGIDELLRNLLGAPLFEKPEIGSNPYGHTEEPHPTGEKVAQLQFMNALVMLFEAGADRFKYRDVVEAAHMSRIMLDLMIADGRRQGLIEQYSDRSIVFTDEGKLFVLKNGLVDT